MIYNSKGQCTIDFIVTASINPFELLELRVESRESIYASRCTETIIAGPELFGTTDDVKLSCS